MRMGRYYPPNDALMQFLQAMQLCVEAIGSMSRRTKGEPLYGGATSHSSVLHIGVDSDNSPLPKAGVHYWRNRIGTGGDFGGVYASMLQNRLLQ